MPKIFIIIVNFNAWRNTLACLESLDKLSYSNFEIIIVDNNSQDDSIVQIEKYLDTNSKNRYHLFTNPVNEGFAEGNNIGITYARDHEADYILLLNNDTIVDENFLNEMIQIGEADEAIGIIGSTIYYESEPDKIWFASAKFSWLGGGRHIIKLITKDSRPSDFITGCALLIKKEVIQKIGQMPIDYFIYYEDIDWCLSAKKAGFKMAVATNAKIWHKISHTTEKLGEPIIQYYHIRNALLLTSRHAPIYIRYPIYLWSIWHYIKQWIKSCISSKTRPINKMIRQGIVSFYKNKFNEYPGSKKIVVAVEGHELEKSNRAGIARILKEEMSAIAKIPGIHRKYKIIFYFNKLVPDDKFLESSLFEKKLLKIPWIPASFTLFYNFLIPLISLINAPNIFYFPSYMVPFLCMGKIIVCIADVVYEAEPNGLPPIHYISYKFLARWGAKRASKIITISEFSKKEIIKYYCVRPDKIVVSHLGVDEKFRNITDESIIESTKNKYKIKNNFILFTAQIFHRRKVVESMLAFETIARDFPDIQFLIIGRNLTYPHKDLFKIIADINKRVQREAIVIDEYIKNDNDLISLFSSAKLFLYISSYEGFGLPPVEALKCGTPPVVTDNEISREILGEGAFFVKNCCDHESIANTLRNALSSESLRGEIVKKGQAHINKFSWFDKGKEFHELLEELTIE